MSKQDWTELARRATELEQTLERKQSELGDAYPDHRTWTATQLQALRGRVTEVQRQLTDLQAGTA
jgi:polyhydroxyalkanoate synthesis regulator phasin